jgi:hypothetical protein
MSWCHKLSCIRYLRLGKSGLIDPINRMITFCDGNIIVRFCFDKLSYNWGNDHLTEMQLIKIVFYHLIEILLIT